MHRFKLLLAAALLAAAAASPASALPPGSYLQTCQNFSESGATLTASCRTRAGTTRRSSIDAGGCRRSGGTISNENGSLTCIGRLPAGSYQKSCASRVYDGLLRASCRSTSGQIVHNEIVASSCAGGDLANINGRLRCIR
jgi:hypothetical protein